MQNVRLIIAIILFGACSVASVSGNVLATASGKQEPLRFRWKERSITIAVSSSLTKPNPNIKFDSDVIGAVRRSFETWQNISGVEFQLEFTDRQNVSPAGVAGDGVNLITVAASPENTLFFAKDSQSASGKARVFYNRRGFITEADIVLNPFQQFSTDGTFGTFDLQSTLTHEIGHMLGLRHSGVIGSAMSDKLPKNGGFGLSAFWPRTLTDSDMTSIRDLYGAGLEANECCSAIAGKLVLQSGRPVKNLRVWAEESESGRVIAQTETNSDGSYRLGGLPGGEYRFFWKARAESTGTAIGSLGTIQTEIDETKIINQKISVDPSEIVLNYIGINSQIAESGISIVSGREQTIYVGGKNLDARSTTVDFDSPYLHIVPSSLANQDFGEDISVISFIVTSEADTPLGVYSIFATGKDGSRTSLIGAIRVE